MKLDQVINKTLEESGYRDNIYFLQLKQGAFAKEDFVETQIQFASAVVFFPRAMSALIAKIPDGRQRIEIIKNVFEEHGEGSTEDFHGNTFLTFLKRLDGISKEDVQQRTLWPEVRMFDTTLIGACVLDEYLVSTALIGIIERMFVDISFWISQGVIAQKWMTPDQMIHYNAHEELDVKHAQDFFDVLTGPWEMGPRERYYIQQGLRMGARLFDGLYTGLYNARQRRWMAETGTPAMFL